MAERRYGFRFSFAEGGVIVVSMIGAAFLVFLFGVYAGRELEARKNAENTRTVRVNTLEKASDALSEGIHESSAKIEEKKESTAASPTAQEAAKTVVVVTPQKQNQAPAETPTSPIAPSSASPLVPPEKEELGKTEVLQKVPPVLVKKAETPPPPAISAVRERKPVPRERVSAVPPPEKLQTTGSGWSVQLHASRDENAARQIAVRLRGQGYAPVVSKIVRDGEVWYRVRVGSFRTAEEARTSVERFRREGKFSQAYPVSD